MDEYEEDFDDEIPLETNSLSDLKQVRFNTQESPAIESVDSSDPKEIPGTETPIEEALNFEVTIWLEATMNIPILVHAFLDTISDEHSANRKYWLCWTIADETFQSDEYSFQSGDIPTRIKHTFKAESQSPNQLRNCLESTPLRIFLCTNDYILAKSDVAIKLDSLAELPEFKLSSGSCISYSMAFNWFDLNPLFKSTVEIPTVQLEIGAEIKQIDLPKRKSSIPKLKSTKLAKAIKVDPEIIDESSLQTRRYRLSIDVRSVSNLRRPAYAGIAFSYTHLGYNTTLSAPVRTHPQWVVANSEVKIDTAKVSYDFCMNRHSLEEITRTHPLKVQLTSRSHLGTDLLGEVSVDLIPTILASPIAFRCPITGKQFRTLKEYQAHRYSLATAVATNRIEKLPPKEPTIIRAVDGYYTVQPTGNSGPTAATADGAKIRVTTILEDLGVIGNDIEVPVKPGYKMHNGALYEQVQETKQPETGPHDPLQQDDLSPHERAHLEALRLDWENWRKATEIAWMTSLKEKEAQLREVLKTEMLKNLEERGAGLKSAQEENARLEIRLRQGIDNIDRQKQQLILKEEQINGKLAQKTEELQLLQRRIRDEAKAKIETETRKCESLKSQVSALQDALDRMEKRAIASEKEYESFRQFCKTTPEAHLREENIRLKVQLSESRIETERERRLRSETEAEKEHHRAQLHRVATALKREREKNSILARQEIEQLRLEYVAREERYILDGDRDELRNIRHELANLRDNFNSAPRQSGPSVNYSSRAPDTSNIRSDVPSPSKKPSSEVKEENSPSKQQNYNLNSPNRSLNETFGGVSDEKTAIIRNQIEELEATGLYDGDDPVFIELYEALNRASV